MVLLSDSSSPFPALVASFRGLFSGSTSNLVILTTFLCLSAPIAFYLYRYRSNIREKVKEIEQNVALVKVVRNKNGAKKNRVVCMELDPNFVKANPDWKMMSFGEYLSQLEPADPDNAFNQMFLQKELNILIGKFLLDNMGKTYGAALLPLMGAGSVAASIAGISNSVSKFMAKSILEDARSDSADGEGVNSNEEKSANDAPCHLIYH